MKLTQLSAKQSGRIARLTGSDALRQRLVALGVLRGQPISVAATSLWGNPKSYRIGLQQICLRDEDAACIEVELLS